VSYAEPGVVLQVWCSAEMLVCLRERVEREGSSVSAFVRGLIERALAAPAPAPAPEAERPKPKQRQGPRGGPPQELRNCHTTARISLPVALALRARAAERGVSISRLAADLLTAAVQPKQAPRDLELAALARVEPCAVAAYLEARERRRRELAGWGEALALTRNTVLSRSANGPPYGGSRGRTSVGRPPTGTAPTPNDPCAAAGAREPLGAAPTAAPSPEPAAVAVEGATP
jgi:hypothetical protein